MLRHELAKNEIVAVVEKRNHAVTVDYFEKSTGWGFMTYVTALPADYRQFSDDLFAVGLEPDLKRVKKTPTVWHYEVMVEVPESWEPGNGTNHTH